MSKKMKRANGTGSVLKLSGNRRNPWFARVTLGFDEKSYPIYKILQDKNGVKYFPNRKMPDLLLAKYNLSEHNFNMDKTGYTFEQLYNEWSGIYMPSKKEIINERKNHEKAKGKLGSSNANGMKSAFKAYKDLHQRIYTSLKKSDFQNIINMTEGKRTKLFNMKNLILKLDEYAMEQDVIEKGYGQFIDIMPEPSISSRMPFTYKEINTIWQNEGRLCADILLILLYSGMRIEELLIVEIDRIFLDEDYLITGLKTDSGKNRIIPIHHSIKSIILRYYDKDNKYLFMNPNTENSRIEYGVYRYMFREFADEVGLSHHTSHETRYTVRSELDRLGANKVSTDNILGHKGDNIGETVYTKKSIEELKETIELLDYQKKKSQKITYLKVAK